MFPPLTGCDTRVELERLIGGKVGSKVEKVKALGANGDVSGSRVGVVLMEVGGGIMRARMGELSLEETSKKSVRGIFWRILVEELALEAMEYDDQGMGYEEGCLQVEVGSCKEWDQECSCLRDHSPPLGEELEKVNRMTRSWEELKLGDEAFFPCP
ncbi:hypothetical protein Tco_0212319 [Tanacetum coccineum]